MEAIRKDKRYTYADYLTWDDDVRYELIDGVPYMMGAPNLRHQEIAGELYGQLRDFLKGKSCKPFIAPVDVRLNHRKGDNMVVQPDLLVVCDPKKLEDGKSVKGAPDFIIEILSPSNAGHDQIVKLNKYMQAGVREYWIVDPERKTVQVYILKGGIYAAYAYGEETDSIPVSVLSGCAIDLKEIFIV
ncbi:MAG: Uma2 family endonuclease [Oscillospiraceae bacterium]|nr:Uma2 family endonuclease [Oscillospiraceae bacterium]